MYKYVVREEDGQILLRANGPYKPRPGELVVPSKERMHPAHYMYDTKLKSFQKKPDSVLAAHRRHYQAVGEARKQQQQEKASEFAKLFHGQRSKSVKRMFELMLEVPHTVLKEEIKKTEG